LASARSQPNTKARLRNAFRWRYRWFLVSWERLFFRDNRGNFSSGMESTQTSRSQASPEFGKPVSTPTCRIGNLSHQPPLTSIIPQVMAMGSLGQTVNLNFPINALACCIPGSLKKKKKGGAQHWGQGWRAFRHGRTCRLGYRRMSTTGLRVSPWKYEAHGFRRFRKWRISLGFLFRGGPASREKLEYAQVVWNEHGIFTMQARRRSAWPAEARLIFAEARKLVHTGSWAWDVS